MAVAEAKATAPTRRWEPGAVLKDCILATLVAFAILFPTLGIKTDSTGGLVIGLIETFWSAYFTIEYKDVAAFSMLAIVLIFFPTGLLGRPEVEKV